MISCWIADRRILVQVERVGLWVCENERVDRESGFVDIVLRDSWESSINSDDLVSS